LAPGAHWVRVPDEVPPKELFLAETGQNAGPRGPDGPRTPTLQTAPESYQQREKA